MVEKNDIKNSDTLSQSKLSKARQAGQAIDEDFWARHGQPMVWGVILFFLFGVLFALREILLPFVAGAIIAYFLHPVVTYSCHKGIKRGFASAFLILLSVVLLIALFATLIPLIGEQLIGLIERLPSTLHVIENSVSAWLNNVINMLGMARADQIRGQISSLSAEGTTYLVNFAGRLIESGLTVFNVLSLLFVTPIVAFYMLMDWSKAIGSLEGMFPRRYAALIHGILSDIDDAISAYLRGQLSVMIILGSFYAVILSVIGLDFSLAIGAFAGLMSFVPYVGAISGLIVATIMALIQFAPDWIWVGVVVAVFVLGQLLEEYVLLPRLVGAQINIHPVWMIFALFAFGTLFGLVGVFLAVPLAAITAVLVRYGIVFYKKSQLYEQPQKQQDDGQHTNKESELTLQLETQSHRDAP